MAVSLLTVPFLFEVYFVGCYLTTRFSPEQFRFCSQLYHSLIQHKDEILYLIGFLFNWSAKAPNSEITKEIFIEESVVAIFSMINISSAIRMREEQMIKLNFI